MKKVALILSLSFFPLVTEGAGIAAIALGALQSCAVPFMTRCCVPCLKCCTGLTHDFLEQNFPSNDPQGLTHDFLEQNFPSNDPQAHKDKDKELATPLPPSGNVTITNYYNFADQDPAHHAQLQKIIPDHALRRCITENIPAYDHVIYASNPTELLHELKTTVRAVDEDSLLLQEKNRLQHLEMVDLKLAENIHLLVFNNNTHVNMNKEHILYIQSAVDTVNDFVFDELFPRQGLTPQQSAEKDVMRKLASVLNQAASSSSAKASSSYPDGLYVSTSGRKFYKFHHTYILPLRSDEVTPGFEIKPTSSFRIRDSFDLELRTSSHSNKSGSSSEDEKVYDDDDALPKLDQVVHGGMATYGSSTPAGRDDPLCTAPSCLMM